MASLLANFLRRDPSLRRTGGQPRSQTVTRIARRIDTNRTYPCLYDQTYGLTGQWLKTNLAVAVDWSKQRTIHDAGPSQPLFEGTHGAPTAPRERNTDLATLGGLIGLRETERENDALTHTLNVAAGQAHQFRPSETSREPDQKQRPVTQVSEALPGGV